jgi:glycosyltransferase involved in cell wall biosynthesis
VHELGIQNSVNFAGILPHERIIPLMREHDLVVVPTRHEFGEGMPGTIYEGFCSRTPVLLSDHPVFIKRFRDRQHVMIFRERDPDDLAARIVELISTPALYNLLSVNSLAAWQQLQLPVGWGMLITSVLRGEPSDHKWLRDHSLGSGRYDAM